MVDLASPTCSATSAWERPPGADRSARRMSAARAITWMPAPPASSADLSTADLHSIGFLKACPTVRGARDNSVREPVGITAILGVADRGDRRQTAVRTPGAAPA